MVPRALCRLELPYLHGLSFLPSACEHSFLLSHSQHQVRSKVENLPKSAGKWGLLSLLSSSRLQSGSCGQAGPWGAHRLWTMATDVTKSTCAAPSEWPYLGFSIFACPASAWQNERGHNTCSFDPGPVTESLGNHRHIAQSLKTLIFLSMKWL